MATETTIRANKSGTKYFYIKNGGAEGGASNENSNYVGNYDCKEYRSRLSFSPDKNKFKDQLIIKAVVRVYVRSTIYSTPTILKINTPNGSQADSNSAYVSAKYCMKNEKSSPTSNGAYIDLEITDSDALKYINEYCTNGQTFSIYLGRKTDSYKSGINYCIYVGVNDDNHNNNEYPRITLTYVPNASTGKISSSNPEIGSKFTVNITSASTDYTHKVIIQSNINSSITIDSGIISGTSWSYTIPENQTSNWIANSTSSQSNTKLIIETYLDNSLLGKNEYNFTLYAKTKPEVSWTTASLNASSGSLSTLVSTYGKATLTLKATPVDTASSISYFRVKINSCNVVVDKKYTATNNSVTINDLPKPYTTSDTNFSINVYAINNRGKESTPITRSTMCYAYALPSLSNLKIIRASDKNGTEDLMGTFIYGTSNIAISSNEGNSFVSTTISIDDSDLNNKITISSSNPLKFYIEGSDAEKEYMITIRITDKVATNTITTKIPSSSFIIHIKTGGKSIGIGSAAGNDETIKLGWKLLVNNGIEMSSPLSVLNGGTGVTSYNGLRQQLELDNYYLKLSGGAISGDLSINGALLTTNPNKAITLQGNNFTYNGKDVLVLNKNVFYSSEEPSNPSIGTIWLKI